MTSSALARLRDICLTLPEAVEKETWENPTFRIRDKIFAMIHQVEGRKSVWCKAPPGAQTILMMAAPERFFRPPYVGHKGWIGIWLDTTTGNPAINWNEVADLIHRSYQMTAPKRSLDRSSPAQPGAPRIVAGSRPAAPATKRPRHTAP